jgi:hypothetical protein
VDNEKGRDRETAGVSMSLIELEKEFFMTLGKDYKDIKGDIKE